MFPVNWLLNGHMYMLLHITCVLAWNDSTHFGITTTIISRSLYTSPLLRWWIDSTWDRTSVTSHTISDILVKQVRQVMVTSTVLNVFFQFYISSSGRYICRQRVSPTSCMGRLWASKSPLICINKYITPCLCGNTVNYFVFIR